MTRVLISILSLFVILFSNTNGLNVTEYLSYIEDLSRDPHFVAEYTKWALELSSDPEYMYGASQPFPCSTKGMQSTEIPTSVHALRPGDIQCVGAIGDSITAGMGAHALTPIGVLLENRGVSWSAGGDHTYEKMITLPNILRLYNPNLKGFSTKTSISFLNGQNAKHNGLNVGMFYFFFFYNYY
ncbi:unnamed protein product [Adineta steineri]|uniref:Uncharacterized protein n=1 Tax=Adineta steineri TaxID=433720 RepID=A0A814VB09_9BILA|nr:unnamed protein product [Adineta steineri]CAF1427731.1 unnamed protein product [Adineta steineri]